MTGNENVRQEKQETVKDSLAQNSQNILKIWKIYGLSYFERTNTRETNETGGDWALLRFWPKSSPFGLFSSWWLGGKGASEKCNLSSFHQVITTCHPPQAFIEARRTMRTAFYFSVSKKFKKKQHDDELFPQAITIWCHIHNTQNYS